jgi:uncharacterized protein (DUF983 family)
MLKGNKLYSILFNKCPHCQEGDFFENKQIFNLKQFDKIHKRCSVCGENFEPEPGFYTGAMYISYAFNVAFIVTTFVIFVGFVDVDPVKLLYYVVPCLVIFTTIFFRLARRIWINFFVDYNADEASYPKNKPTYKA